MAGRYKVLDGSQSGHCCFDATVVDTTKPTIIRGKPWPNAENPQYKAVCECFDSDAAELIAKTLNAAS
jgi:hypothetical protein